MECWDISVGVPVIPEVQLAAPGQVLSLVVWLGYLSVLRYRSRLNGNNKNN